jgi:hypothetical protein
MIPVICSFLACDPSGATPPKNNKAKGSDQIPLDQLIKAVQDALDEAAKHPVEGFPRLRNVTIVAQTTVTKDASGQIKLFVISLGGAKTTQNVSALTFELKPPSEGSYDVSPKPEDIKNALARGIESAKLGFVSLKQTGATSLKTDKVELQIGFDVTKSVSGGPDVSFTLISAAEVSLTGKYTRETNNTVTLTFSAE